MCVNRVHASDALLLSSLQAETGEPEGQPSSLLPHAANGSSSAVATSKAGLDTETHRLANQTVLQRRFSCTDVEMAQRRRRGRGGHNNAQAANLRAMAIYWGPFLRLIVKASGLVTALCVLSMLIVLTDIMLQPGNDGRLICLSSPGHYLVASFCPAIGIGN